MCRVQQVALPEAYERVVRPFKTIQTTHTACEAAEALQNAHTRVLQAIPRM